MFTKIKKLNLINPIRKRRFSNGIKTIFLILLFLVFLMKPADFGFASITDGTIDSIYKYAWGENVGWINFGTTEGNVHITDSELTGYAWGENIGWISLNCSNDNSCSTVDYKVSNDGEGNLSGYAWSENTGWINFNPTYGGVSINSSGEFLGYAWGENIGWIVFNCSTTNSCGTVDYKVKTDWRPKSERPACNNATDDDNDGKTDYPNDPGCDSLSDTDETDAVGEGMPSDWNNPPKAPKEGFKVLINQDAEYTDSPMVILNLFGGTDTDRMVISNNPEFSDTSSTGQISYQSSYQWNLCENKKACNEGKYKVFVKFYTSWGKQSEIVSDSIIYKKEIAALEKEAVPIKEKPIIEKSAEATSTKQIAKLPLYKAKPSVEKQKKIPASNSANKQSSFIKEMPEILKPFVPEFLKPETPEIKKEIPIEELVPKQAPLAFQGKWQLLSSKPIREFVLAPLPKEIETLSEKFPKLKKTLKKVYIEKITDVEKLRTAKLTLPGLTERITSKETGFESTHRDKFALQKAIPVIKLSPQMKQQIPTEIIFARTAGELIDFNIALSIDAKGKPQQKISIISGKPLQLVVKPNKPVKSVKGYVAFKSKRITNYESRIKNQELSIIHNSKFIIQNLTASAFFAAPAFAQEHNPAKIETRLVLLEFEYTDSDNDGIYTAEIQAPLIEGEYEIITVMDYEDPELGKKEIRLITVVDPEGYIFEKDGDKETRIPGAIVSIFWLNQKTKQYELWSAKEYQQENPQITDATGRYSFLVPNGSYYLKVEAPGYLVYDSKPFQIKKDRGVHINIELKTKYWWLKIIDWRTVLLILVVILLLYNFYRDKMRDRIMKHEL